MNFILLGILFVLGLVFGSFLNAFEYRLKNKLEFVKARSHCPKCKHVLSACDLFPVLSYIGLRGRCRYCETKVSCQYPIVEFISGLLFLFSGMKVLSYLEIMDYTALIKFFLFSLFIGFVCFLFLFFAVYDLKYKLVPNKVVYPSLLLSLLLNLLFFMFKDNYILKEFFEIWGGHNLVHSLLAGFLGGLFIFMLIVFTKGKGMGGGDLKLIVFMGLLLGLGKFLVAFFIAVLTGSIAGIAWGAYKRKIKGQVLPFALFLSLGAVLAIFVGEYIISWYVGALYNASLF